MNKGISFYKGLYKLSDVKNINIFEDNEKVINGIFEYKNMIIGFVDHKANEDIFIYNTILRKNIFIDVNGNYDEFELSLDKLKKELEEIPTITKVKVNYSRSNDIEVQIENSIPYVSDVNDSENIISGILNIFYLSDAKLFLFELENKNSK